MLLLSGTLACSARLIPRTAPAPLVGAEQIAASLFLIGDAGAPARGGEPVLLALATQLEAGPDSILVVFLGDNVYPHGLPGPGSARRKEAERRLDAQLHVVAVRSVRAVFIPGNHDWDKSGQDGLNAIRRQGDWIAERGGGRARMLPANGCPGPVTDDFSGVRIIYLDTEWWLTPHSKAGEADGCSTGNRDSVLARLGRSIEEAGPRPVFVAGHHPLATGGEHGGYFGPADHLFPLRQLNKSLWLPLPQVGTLYPAMRGSGISDEDVRGGRYQRLRGGLDSVFAMYPPLLYAAGHEHSLQLIDRGQPPLLAVSGSGIRGHQSYVQALPESRLALSEPGFMRVDLLIDGRLRLGVLTVDASGRAHEVHAEWLRGDSDDASDVARPAATRARE